MNTFLKAARELAEHDLRIFPLKPKTKNNPLIKWGKGASTSPKIIDKWWERWPDANVAVATGNGLMVLDLDGLDAQAYAEEKGTPDTPVSRTGRTGGEHLWLAGDGRNSRGTIYPGIDVRGQGGFAVAPPSIHPNGKSYEWLTDLDQPFAPFPQWALQATEKPRERLDGNGSRENETTLYSKWDQPCEA